MYTVAVSNLAKSFGSVQAVTDVSFAVERGEIFGLLGPNGARKTTTIRMMLEIFRPDHGTVSILDGPMTEEKKDRIGYMPVGLSLFPVTAPVTMPLRLSLTQVPLWQIAASIAIQGMLALAALWLAARVFRLGMLRYGRRLDWRAVLGTVRRLDAGCGTLDRARCGRHVSRPEPSLGAAFLDTALCSGTSGMGIGEQPRVEPRFTAQRNDSVRFSGGSGRQLSRTMWYHCPMLAGLKL